VLSGLKLVAGSATNAVLARSPLSMGARKTGETEMARFEIADIECAVLGEAPAGADTFFELGMMYSVGRSVPIDFVTAHKWFNLAALRGNSDAIRLRREIADQMSEAEIAQAQRAARAWLKAG
jgi:TPR repeat protein